jgi:hypothetical protein
MQNGLAPELALLGAHFDPDFEHTIITIQKGRPRPMMLAIPKSIPLYRTDFRDSDERARQ